jgi:hypothetical protein
MIGVGYNLAWSSLVWKNLYSQPWVHFMCKKTIFCVYVISRTGNTYVQINGVQKECRFTPSSALVHRLSFTTPPCCNAASASSASSRFQWRDFGRKARLDSVRGVVFFDRIYDVERKKPKRVIH